MILSTVLNEIVLHVCAELAVTGAHPFSGGTSPVLRVLALVDRSENYTHMCSILLVMFEVAWAHGCWESNCVIVCWGLPDAELQTALVAI
eukprot:5926488-Amphidinium_carterae.1